MQCPALVGAERTVGTWRPVAMLPTQWRSSAHGFRFFRNLLVQETVGVTRTHELVDVPLEKVESRAVRVVRVDKPGQPVPAQIELRCDPDGRKQRVVRFVADVTQRGATRYIVLVGGRGRTSMAGSDLKIKRSGAGGTWENSRLSVKLDTRSGQLSEVRMRDMEAEPTNGTPVGQFSHRAAGYFDGVHEYVPWEWSRPEGKFSRGPAAVSIVREGLLPHQTSVLAQVRYTLPVGSPYILVETSLRFTAETDANTLFNDSCLFGHNEFTQASWKEADGAIGKTCIFLPPEKKRSRHTRRTVIPEHLDWIVFADHGMGRAVASLHLGSECDGRPGRYKARTDVCAAMTGQWWTRFAIHGECDEADERRYREMVPIRAGSTLRETTAYLFCRWDHATGNANVDRWFQRLRNPVKVVDVPFGGK